MTRTHSLVPVLAFGAAYAVLVALVGNSYHLLILTVVPVWAVMGLSWNLLSGYSGLVSFGHAAFFGLGAYFVALSQIHWNLSPWFGIPGAAAIGGLAGLLVGLPTFRLRGHYFALAMLAYPLALLYLFEWLGYQEVTLPMRRNDAVAFMQFGDPRVLALLSLLLLLASMLLTLRLEHSRFGLSLAAIKQDEAAAEAAGIRALSWKLKAIAASGAMAGAIGGFYAVVLLVVTPPAVFGMLVSAQALIVAMFGGAGTMWGPVIGALLLVPLSEILHAKLAHVFPGVQGVVYGIAIIAVILVAPEGIVWKLRAFRRRGESASALPAETLTAAPAVGSERQRTASGGRPLLEVRGIAKSFGGLDAVRDVGLEVRRGEILGIIGPNGAGKTTLFNLLNGFQKADRGQVLLEGRDVTGSAPHELCAAGVGRTFQVVKPFRRMSVLDNVIVGAYVHAPGAVAARDAALEALEQTGLTPLRDRLAGSLPLRDLRLLELARALAGKPTLLLLDETLAGLGAADAEAVLEVIRQISRAGLTVVIIEHTMPAMVRLVDRFVVLDHGQVLAQGTPAEVTQNPAVIDAYLGKRWRAAHAGHP